MHVVITFPRVVQSSETFNLQDEIKNTLAKKPELFFLCCKFARVIIKREGGPKSFCPTCQELSKNLLQFFSLFFLSRKSWRVKKKVLIEFMMSTEVGEKS